jgi:hypothetical protein
MTFGMSIHAFTVTHVLISFIGILTGIYMVVGGLMRGRLFRSWTYVFLGTTFLTSVTGFLFPITGFTPALGVGVVSLAVLALASFEFTRNNWGGSGRWIYATSATVALYLNVFVLVAQAFQKVPLLHALAPTGTEPAFIIAQLLILGLFVFVGIRAAKHFHPPVETRASA